MMFKLNIFTTVLLLACSAYAEFRIWENTKGDVWEAEFVAMNAGRVVLRNQAGEKAEYSPDNLCKADQEYLEKRVPPRLSIDVSKTTDNTGSGRNSEKVQCLASIKQIDTRPYSGKLIAVLVTVGEDKRTGAVSIANKKEWEFSLPDNRGDEVEFKSDPVQFIKSSANAGRLYGGYILVVWDRFGNAVAIESNRDSYLENATKLAGLSLKRKIMK